ncbi:methyl-CpG-binding domain-containing protein 13-like [Panicum miliaceum]|uniref:Methyl-CpG-binding domain-containing protein 13-like n=1 Tax=Panicum miliaceum TaxID=4540 RepID=A0A3L6RL02_PANMI|nr:methyl-CpG-binding domain-containing protein 13-like [Panicum miliaceum]
MDGLPDGWRREWRPRKIGSFQDPFYIDPVSGYEFRSLKDVHRYLETGDINQCAMKPKKGSTIYGIHITESQTLTNSSSQHTRPSTADKGIQCEILTSDGVMMPWEELITPYSENDTEDTVLPESESLKAMQGYGNKVETLEHTSVEPVSAQRGTRETKYLKRKEQNVQVRSKKRKTNPAVTTIRVSPRLAALNVQQEASIEPEDQPVNANPIYRVHTIEENSNNQSQMSQSGTVNQIHGNLQSTFNQLQLSQADTAEGMEDIQENTTNHPQPSQVDAVNHIQTNQEKTANQVKSILADIPVLDDRSITDHADFPTQTMQECTKDPLSQSDFVSHIQTDQDYTANQLQSSLAETVIPVQPFQEYTIDYSQPGKADTVNRIQTNQESTGNHFHLSQVDTATKMQIIQENLTRQPNLSQADNVGQAHIDLGSTIDYSQLSKADTINQLQANQENTADQLHFSQVDCVTQIQIIQGNMSKHPQLSEADTVDRIHINGEGTTNHLQPNYAENSMLQAGLSWAPEQNGGADFWKIFENQDSLVTMPVAGTTVASFPANVRFQNAAGTEEPALLAQSAAPETGSDQLGLGFQSPFGNAWSDPCIEFAFKTLTGDIPILDDTMAVTNYFPEQQDLNKDPSPNCSASVLDNTKNHTQVDVNLPAPMPSDKLYNGSWFPPQ